MLLQGWERSISTESEKGQKAEEKPSGVHHRKEATIWENQIFTSEKLKEKHGLKI